MRATSMTMPEHKHMGPGMMLEMLCWWLLMNAPQIQAAERRFRQTLSVARGRARDDPVGAHDAEAAFFRHKHISGVSEPMLHPKKRPSLSVVLSKSAADLFEGGGRGTHVEGRSAAAFARARARTRTHVVWSTMRRCALLNNREGHDLHHRRPAARRCVTN